MLVLFETPAGLALFKVLKEGKIKKEDDLFKYFESPEKASKFVKMHAFKKFKDTKEALKTVTKMLDGKLTKKVKKFLKSNCITDDVQETIMCFDKDLASTIQKKLGIECETGKGCRELIRGIRYQMNALLEGLSDKEMTSMSLGLAHSVSRYRLKFTTDKVDTMIVQAVSLLSDIDKELNNYAMRLKEWYSWHFPELEKIVGDNDTYAKVVLVLGRRQNIKTVDLSGIVPDEIAEDIQKAVEISFGTEILEEDEINIKALASQVSEMTEYRATLSEYLSNRMNAISPNLTTLIGELVAAKLIAHAGSLMNLAKLPASTIQILGAEKALFRAMKTKKNTPKYGLIYNASLVGQAQAKFKGRIARTLAAKASLCVRYDALGEDQDGSLGTKTKAFIEHRLETMEGDFVKNLSKPGNKNFQKYAGGKREREYNTDRDMGFGGNKRARNME